MKLLVANLVLGLLWIALTGRVSALDFGLGLVVAYVVLRWSLHRPRRSTYFAKVSESVRFSGFFLRELVASSLKVAHDVMTPALHMLPAVLAVPLDADTDVEITLLGCLINLTPGTLTIDVSADRQTLYVHVMFARDHERARARLKDFERPVLRLMR